MGALLARVETRRQPDGVTLICASRRDVPLVGTSLVCAGGRACDLPHRPGLANLTAALWAEGPQSRKPLEWHRTLEQDAISLGMRADTAHWEAGALSLTEQAGTALGRLAECLASPGWHASEWRRLVRAHRASAREHWAQPGLVLDALSAVQCLGYLHPGAHPPSERSYARARYAEAVALGNSALRRGQGTYAMAGGDISPDEAWERLSELLSVVPQADGGPRPEPVARPAGARVWLMDHPGLDQAFFALSRPGARGGDPDRVALRLADYALGGGGFSSRLMERARNEMGHTYGIHSSCPLGPVLSPFRIQSFTQVGNLKPLLDMVSRELESVARRGFSEDEVNAARDHFYGALPLHLTTPQALLEHVLHGFQSGLGLARLEADWEALRSTPLEQVNAAARRLVGDGVFHLAVIGPARQIERQVDTRGGCAVFGFRTPPDRWPRA